MKQLPINFTLTDAAKDRILWLMHNTRSEKCGPPVLATIAWAIDLHADGRRIEGPAIGFYDAVGAVKVKGSIQVVNGLDVIYFVNEATWQHFQDRIVDFSDYRGFYLQ